MNKVNIFDFVFQIKQMEFPLFVNILLICLLGVNARVTYYNSNAVISNDIGDFMEIPPHTDYARMARYIVHQSNWGAMGSLSTLNEIRGFPMVNVISIADSAVDGNSTGRIYFFLTTLDFTGQDLRKQNKLTLLLSMDQNLACTKEGIDPMEPTCSRIMITGRANVVRLVKYFKGVLIIK